MTLGPIHRRHQADSLIPTLVSLLHWTPFYWGQDRFGMLVPLLVAPVRHPLANLLLQAGLSMFGGLASAILLARYVAPGPGWPLAGGLAAAALIAVASPPVRFAYLVELPFGIGLALCLGGLLLVESRRSRPGRGRLTASVTLVVLGHWVNAAAGLPLLLCELLRRIGALFGHGERDPAPGGGWVGRLWSIATKPSVLVLVVGLVVGDALRWTANQYRTSRGLLAPADWPGAWAAMALDAWGALGLSWWPLALVGLAGAGSLLALRPAGRRAFGAAAPGAAIVVLAALLYIVPIAPMRWVAHNHFAYRYAFPSILLIQAALLSSPAAAVAAVLGERARARLALVGAALIVAGAVWVSGAPSLQRARAAVDERLGARTADVLALEATHVAGDYWCVWPVVYHANLVLHERGAGPRIWGVAFRSDPTWRLARPAGDQEPRIAVPPGDVPVGLLARYGLTPLVVVDRRPTAWLLRIASAGVSGEPLRERYDVAPPVCPRAEDPID
jgi:hypothetical protein